MKFQLIVRETHEYEVEADSYDEAVRLFADRELEDKAILWSRHDGLVQVDAETPDGHLITLYQNPQPGSDAAYHDHHPASEEGTSALLVYLASN